MKNSVTLGSISTMKTGPFGTQLSADEYTSTGTPVINVRNIGYGEIITDTLEYINNSTRNRLSTHLLRTGDIVFGRKGSVDRHAYIDEQYNGWMQGSDCIRLRFQAGINSRYVSHFLKLNYVKKQINNAAVGSTMASLNTDILNRVKIILPSLEKQNKLEQILSILESKITLNKRINAELEAMAKTIYDYWFVQFDFPDENGKPYRTSGGAMEYNDQLKREIPKGWKVGQFCDVANIIMGQSPSGDSYNEQGVGMAFFQGSADFGTDSPSTRVYTTEPSRIAQQGDILLSVRAPVGTMNTAFEKCCIGRGLAAINSKAGANTYLSCLVAGHKKRFDVLNGNGTTFGSLTKDTLLEIPVIIPLDKIIRAFEKALPNYAEMRFNNERQIRELTRLRDWLLPMLMNGQATVDDEQPVETPQNVVEMPGNDKRFDLWLQNQGIAARGDLDKKTLREIFDAMDDDDK